MSIGTGTCKAKQMCSTDPGLVFSNNSLQQTFKHYWRDNFDGDKKFLNMRHMMAVTLPDEASDIDQWLRRFNLPLDAELPDLADAQAMDGLAAAAWAHFASDPALHDLARAVLASSFYFELRCLPIYEKECYTCYGRILCRVPVTKPAFSALMRKLGSMCSQFLIQGRASRERKPTAFAFDRTGNFSKPLCFRVRNLEDHLDVRLKFPDTHSYHISASPMSIKSLIKLQKLEWVGLSKSGSKKSCSAKRSRSNGFCARTAKRHCFAAQRDQAPPMVGV